MAKFRKKPVVIEAVQFGPDRGSMSGTFSWARKHANGRAVNDGFDEKGYFLLITTLEGVHRADEGDWIIQGVKGELYPCKPDIFEATYEPV